MIPIFANPPKDQKLQNIIDSLIKYVLKHGQYFENKVKINHKTEDDFQFLFGGEGSEYYKWAIYKQVSSSPNYVPQSLNQFYPTDNSITSEASRPLIPIEITELSQLIENLAPTQSSIRVNNYFYF